MNTDSTYMIELGDPTFKRGSRMAFDNIDVRIPRRKVTDIIGPLGCGETTLLRLIASQLYPSKEEVWIDRRNLPQLSRGDLFDMRKQFGVLFQSGALLIDLDIFESIMFPLCVHTQLPEETTRDVVLMKLQAVGLYGAMELMPDEPSNGMECHVALVQAIALDPQVLLYDEPFAGQGPTAMDALVRLIRLLNDVLNITSIVTSHDLTETTSIANYVCIIDDGRVLDHGAPDVLKETDDLRIRQSIKGIPDGPVPFHYPARDYRADLLGEH